VVGGGGLGEVKEWGGVEVLGSQFRHG